MDEQILLQAISQMMDEKLKPIDARLNQLDTKLDRLENNVEELKEQVSELAENEELTREGVNTLLDWAERAASVINVPLIK